MPLFSGDVTLAEVAASCLPVLVQLFLFSYMSIFIHAHSLTFFSLNDLPNAVLELRRNVSYTNSVENGHLSSSLRQSSCSLIKEVCGYMDISADLSASLCLFMERQWSVQWEKRLLLSQTKLCSYVTSSFLWNLTPRGSWGNPGACLTCMSWE